MIAQKALWALLVVGSVSAALTLAPGEETRLRRGIRNPIRVTCEPVKTSEGVMECLPNPPVLRKRHRMFAELERVQNPVKCLVVMSDRSLSLPNECQEVAERPGFFRCSVTIPRTLLNFASCWMQGFTTSYEGHAFISRPKIPSFRVCRRECQSYSWRRFSCVVNEECRLCMEDFRTLFPGEKINPIFCKN